MRWIIIVWFPWTFARMGAMTDHGLSFNEVTGFPITKKDRINMPGLRTPEEVIGGTGRK